MSADRCGIVFLLLLGLCACAQLPSRSQLIAMPGPQSLPTKYAPVIDGRARFREIFCAILQRHSSADSEPRECGEWLWNLDDEPELMRRPLPEPDRSSQVYLVSGAFSECLGDGGRPFKSAVQQLSERGYRIDTIVVGGRSSSEHNASQIAARLAAPQPEEPASVVLIGYSKGTNDILEFLVRYPEAAKRVTSVVSIAGAVHGSALASRGAAAYDAFFSWLPLPHCERGDGGVLDSLREADRELWLSNNPLPPSVRYYSVAAFATEERMARALDSSWKRLLKQDLRNDGQVLASHSLIPGSKLLGYLNADHWSTALDVEVLHPFLGARQDSVPFPREVLLESILMQLADEATRSAAGAPTLLQLR